MRWPLQIGIFIAAFFGSSGFPLSKTVLAWQTQSDSESENTPSDQIAFPDLEPKWLTARANHRRLILEANQALDSNDFDRLGILANELKQSSFKLQRLRHQLDAELIAYLESLLPNLSADRYEERDLATQKILKLGPKCIAPLLSLKSKVENVERRARINWGAAAIWNSCRRGGKIIAMGSRRQCQ